MKGADIFINSPETFIKIFFILESMKGADIFINFYQ
jgi:hypothetical protein